MTRFRLTTTASAVVLTGADIGIPEMSLGSYRDYREGTADFEGQKIHQLHYQAGGGAVITVTWELPEGVTGQLQDFITGEIVDVQMAGEGSFTVENPNAVNKLKMTVTYGGEVSAGSNPASGLRPIGPYPNPAGTSPHVMLEAAGALIVSIEVFDLTGRRVSIRREVVNAGSARLTLLDERVPSGLYVYRVTAQQGGYAFSSSGRFVLQN